jgi:hypothetical protein
LEKNVGLNDSQDPEVSIHIFDKFLTLQTFLRNQQLKILRLFLNEPIVIRVKNQGKDWVLADPDPQHLLTFPQ